MELNMEQIIKISKESLEAFKAKTKRTFYGEDIKKLKEACQLIKDANADYLLPPIIQRIHWLEDNDWELDNLNN